MFEAVVDINAKDYNACTRYYLRKYLGVKEYILLALLLIGGLVLYFAFQQLLILILCGVTVLIMSGAIVVYIAFARKGYTEEFVKRNTHEWKFTFYEEEFSVETLEEGQALYGKIRLRPRGTSSASQRQSLYLLRRGALVLYQIRQYDCGHVYRFL